MLQAIREKAQGWIAWAIVILISIPFALWGIQEYLGVGAEPVVATVDGEEITERMLEQRIRDVRERMRATLGDAYRADLFDDKMLRQQAMDSMIEESVLARHVSNWNMRTSDMQARGYIASIPAFQRDGAFDTATYEAAVRNVGQSTAGFEQSVRQELTIGQLRSGIQDSAFVTDAAMRARHDLVEQKREVSFVRIPASEYQREVEASDAALRKFYDENPDRYRTPERVRLAYLSLDAAGLGALVEVDDQRLKEYFDTQRDEFVLREERAARHILVSVDAAAGDEGAKAAEEKAADLLEQIRTGADFAELAKDNSDDPGSAENGGDLGWVERGMMVPPFEEATFALQKGAVSDLVKTDFGFHIIQVTEVRGGSDASFEDMRELVDTAYRRFEAENLYFDYAERLNEIAYESPDSLTPAAESLGLTVQQSDWITRNGIGMGVLASPKVVNAAFSDDVLIEGNNSELIESGPQQAVVVRVQQHEPAGIKPFDEHRAEIERDFRDAEAARLAKQAGDDRLAALRSGEVSLDNLGVSAWQYNGPESVGREGTELPLVVVAKAFDIAPPALGESVFTSGAATNGDYLLIAVSGVDVPQWNADGQDAHPVRTSVGRQAGREQFSYFVEGLRAATSIEVQLPE